MNYFFITGASSGIGKAIAEELLKNAENQVIGMSRTRSIEHKNYVHIPIDLSTPEDYSLNFESLDPAGRIVLLNNAGALGPIDHYGNISKDDLLATLSLNLLTPATLMNDFIRVFQDSPAEKLIINISSGAAQSPYDGWANYCASKAGLDMLTRVVAQEQAMSTKPYPIKVLAIAPGVVDTAMQTQIRGSDEAGFTRKEKFIELKESGQLYNAEDVAKKFVDIMFNPDQITEVVSRISL